MHKRKVEQKLLQAVSTYIQQHLPPKGLTLVNPTNVSITPNLAMAKIHLAILGKKKAAQEAWLQDFIADHHYPIKRHIAQVLRHTLRKVPSELRFQIDNSHEKVTRIAHLLETTQRPISPREKPTEKKPDHSLTLHQGTSQGLIARCGGEEAS